MDRASEYTGNYPVYEKQPFMIRAYLFMKRTLYYICKWAGLFHAASRLTRGRLRIICYHGFSLVDESMFRPRTFINPDTFYKRMEYLSKKGFTVLELDRALELLDRRNLPPKAVVITIDDGFYSMYGSAYPVLREFSFPATVYVTTYYALKESPVFGLAIQYMFWKTGKDIFDATGLGLPVSGTIPIATSREKADASGEIIQFGETRCSEEERIRLSGMIGDRLEVDYRTIAESRILSIMNKNEIRELAEAGVDIQLHTHRHEFPAAHDGTVREILDNRSALEPLVERPLVHFCYPGGLWGKEQWPWLEQAGIESAATCDRGLNPPGAPRLGLKRFGDDEALSQIEFEAELSGFTEVIRIIQSGLTSITGKIGSGGAARQMG